MGGRVPSIPLTQDPSISSLSVNHNMSSQSLASLASGSVAASDFRSPSPSLTGARSNSQVLNSFDEAASNRGAASSNQGFNAFDEAASNRGAAAGEASRLQQQLQSVEAAHAAEMKQMREEHAAQLAAVQAQAVAKMKELIEKVRAHDNQEGVK